MKMNVVTGKAREVTGMNRHLSDFDMFSYFLTV